MNQELPDKLIKYWTASRKLKIVTAIIKGKLTYKSAMENYQISPEEIDIMINRLKTYGPNGLYVKKKTNSNDAFFKGMEAGIALAKEAMERITKCDCASFSHCRNPVLLMGKFNNEINDAFTKYKDKS